MSIDYCPAILIFFFQVLISGLQIRVWKKTRKPFSFYSFQLTPTQLIAIRFIGEKKIRWKKGKAAEARVDCKEPMIKLKVGHVLGGMLCFPGTDIRGRISRAEIQNNDLFFIVQWYRLFSQNNFFCLLSGLKYLVLTPILVTFLFALPLPLSSGWDKNNF